MRKRAVGAHPQQAGLHRDSENVWGRLREDRRAIRFPNHGPRHVPAGFLREPDEAAREAEIKRSVWPETAHEGTEGITRIPGLDAFVFATTER